MNPEEVITTMQGQLDAAVMLMATLTATQPQQHAQLARTLLAQHIGRQQQSGQASPPGYLAGMLKTLALLDANLQLVALAEQSAGPPKNPS